RTISDDAISVSLLCTLSPESSPKPDSKRRRVADWCSRRLGSIRSTKTSVESTSSSVPKISITCTNGMPTSVNRGQNTVKDITLRDDIFSVDAAPKPAIRTNLPKMSTSVDKTPQLVFSIRLLIKETSSDSSIVDAEERELNDDDRKNLKALREEPMALDHLRQLTTTMVANFINHAAKDSNTIAEVVLLGPILAQDAFRELLSCFISKFDTDKAILNITALQGMVQLVQSASPGFLQDDDMVRILNILQNRLAGVHKASKDHVYQLVLAVSRLLDVMVEGKVKGLDRKRDHQPLLMVLSDLKNGETDPFLKFQVNYALQTLLYLPDDETRLQATFRYLESIAIASSAVASIFKLDPQGALGAAEHLQAAVGNAADVVKFAYEGARSARANGENVLQIIMHKHQSQPKHAWYLALQALAILVRDGSFVEFNKVVCDEPSRFDRNFQRGVCLILGEVAVDPLWDISIRKCAVSFLGELYANNGEWSKHVNVKTWILSILHRIKSTALLDIQEYTRVLLDSLQKQPTIDNQCSHPLRSRLAMPNSSPLLHKVQGIPGLPYLERDLHRLKNLRVKRYGHPVYVPTRAKESINSPNENSFPLLERVLDFLASEQLVFLVLGDSGSGKSTFSRHLENHLWLKYNKEERIPLHINLPTIYAPDRDLVTAQLLLHNFTNDQIREMKQCRKFVLICDGYDEARIEQNLHLTTQVNNSSPGQWDVKMVINCLNLQKQFRPKAADRWDGSSDALFQESVVMPFNIEQIRSYVEQSMVQQEEQRSNQHVEDSTLQSQSDRLSPPTVEGYMERLSALRGMMDLVQNPLLLSISFSLDLSVIERTPLDHSAIKFTRLKLFDDFVEGWIHLGQERLEYSPLTPPKWRKSLQDLVAFGLKKYVNDFLMSLADAIYDETKGNRIPEVRYIKIQDRTSWKEEFFGDEIYATVSREVSPLTKADTTHKFIHQSLLEYFYSLCCYDPKGPNSDGSDGDGNDYHGGSDHKRDGSNNSGGGKDDSGGENDKSGGDRDDSSGWEDNSPGEAGDQGNNDRPRDSKDDSGGNKDNSSDSKDGTSDNEEAPHGSGHDDSLGDGKPNKARPSLRRNPFADKNLLNEPPILQFLVERAQQDKVFRRWLLSTIEKSNFKAKNESLAVANAITILIRGGEHFDGFDLSKFRIGDDGALALSKTLTTNTTLTTLDLRGNNIGNDGALALSEALKTNSTLSSLNLQYNSIGENGAQALAKALKTNKALTTLYLKGNSIGEKGAQALAEALKTNKAFNSIGEKGAQALAEVLKSNKALITLNLNRNSIGENGSLALSEALKTNSTLTSLNLQYNLIGEQGAQALCEALKTNSTLTTLDLKHNPIEENALAVSEALKTNSTLQIWTCHRIGKMEF
ncbi:hypothetical protein BGZ72_002950, partial [Mortierella alpina]